MIKIRLKVSIAGNFHWDRSTFTEKGREVEKEQREVKRYYQREGERRSDGGDRERKKEKEGERCKRETEREKKRKIKKAIEIKRQTETESDINI